MITGASCAGKTTLAAELARRVAGPTGVVEFDAIRHLVVGGVGVMPYPPTTTALEEWSTAVQVCGDICRRHRERGWFCIIDAPVYPDDNPWSPYRREAWAESLGDVTWQLVVLHPTLAEVERRASIRQDRVNQQRLAGMYRAMDGWRDRPEGIVIDPTELDVVASGDLVVVALG